MLNFVQISKRCVWNAVSQQLQTWLRRETSRLQPTNVGCTQKFNETETIYLAAYKHGRL